MEVTVKEKHYILGDIYTYDTEYWKLLLDKGWAYLNITKPNKFFINNIPIENLTNIEFAELIKDYCTIEDGRPDKKISPMTRYNILIMSVQEPGRKYIRKPYDPISNMNVNVSSNPKTFDNIISKFGQELLKLVRPEISEIINDSIVPKEKRKRFLVAHIDKFFALPGCANHLKICREYWDSLIDIVNYIHPSNDVKNSIERVHQKEIIEHKDELKKRASKLKKKLTKEGNPKSAVKIKNKIEEIKTELSSLKTS